MTENDAPAERCLDVLRDSDASLAARQNAFEEILALDRGWWGPYPLRDFAKAVALAEAKRIMGYAEVDRVDWEGIADDALVVLLDKASSISKSPREWFKGVVRMLVLREVERFWSDITAKVIPLSTPACEQDPAEQERREEETLAEQDALICAIQTLPDALRVVAQLLLIERCTRPDICLRLGLEPATLRKRIGRMEKALTAAFDATELGRIRKARALKQR